MRKNHHVVPNPHGGWDVKAEGAQKATRHVPTQREAIDIARQIARRQRTELIIHRPDGRIRDRDSHGADPCPPKDKD